MIAVIFSDVAEYLDEVSSTAEKNGIDGNIVRLTFCLRHGEVFTTACVMSSFTCCGEVVQLRCQAGKFATGGGADPSTRSKMESMRDKIEAFVRSLKLDLRGGAHRFTSEFGM